MIYVKLEINDYELNTLVDTGAAISILPTRFLTTDKLKYVHPVYDEYFTITGEKLEVRGSVALDIDLAGLFMSSTFMVIDNCIIDCIVGMNIITCYKKIRSIGHLGESTKTKTSLI